MDQHNIFICDKCGKDNVMWIITKGSFCEKHYLEHLNKMIVESTNDESSGDVE